MLTPPFVLHRPTSVEEACAIAAELAAANRPFDWVAGGTDLLPNYKWHLNPKGDVISLAHVDGAGWILTGEGVRARVDVREEPIDPAHAWPRRFVAEGFLEAPAAPDRPVFRDAYTLLAPPAPLPIDW